MHNIRHFPIIPVIIPTRKILARLGYNSKKNKDISNIMPKIDSWISQTADIIKLEAVATRSKIILNHDISIVELPEHNIFFKSKNFCSFLKNSCELLTMGITAGHEVAARIKELQKEHQMTKAVVIDAAASEIVDAGFDWIINLFKKELIREGKTLTLKRFSAGYGDLDIRHQADIMKLLDFYRIGVDITESSILIPEKSVTAFCGII